MSDDGANGRMTRRTTIKAGIAVGAAAVTGNQAAAAQAVAPAASPNPVVPTPIPYGTDSNAFRHKGAKSYGILPVVLSASIVSSMHSDAERIPVDQIESGIRIFYEAVREVAGK